MWWPLSHVILPSLPKLDLDYSYSDLSDIVQLDGPADESGDEDEFGVPLDENDFLGLINAEAIKALQEGEGSSDGNSISSSSDSEAADDLAIVEEEVNNRRGVLSCHRSIFANRTSFWKTPASLRRIYISHPCLNTLFSPNAPCVDKDPLNSGDDVIEQDIPDLFDTDNVIVCQYDKVRRARPSFVSRQHSALNADCFYCSVSFLFADSSQ